MRLAEPRKKGLLSILFSRTFLIVLLLLLQILLFVMIFGYFREYIHHLAAIKIIFTAVVILFLFNSDMDSSAKLTWMLMISIFPVPAAIFLCYSKSNLGHRVMTRRVAEMIGTTMNSLPQDPGVIARLAADDSGTDDLHRYINRSGCFPISTGNETRFFPLGDLMLPTMLEELEKARRFIYLEFFIIEEGEMWGSMLDILARKAAEGVDVRVMYDGMCEISNLPFNYTELLGQVGIRGKSFSPIRPIVSTHYNYRDHRKIMVIDGVTAFTGGVNLADEYINEKERFGHWKDTGLLVRGPAAASFTLMFLQMWNANEEQPDFSLVPTLAASLTCEDRPALEAQSSGDADAAEGVCADGGSIAVSGMAAPAEGVCADGCSIAVSGMAASAEGVRADGGSIAVSGTEAPAEVVSADGCSIAVSDTEAPAEGYVMPYADCPLDNEKVGENVYIDILYKANKYVHIMTPYLILDGEVETALCYAAERGIDVKIILPGIPDKPAAFALAKSHYRRLVGSGVKVYEYTPGFVHAKIFVSDDCKAVVGTINMDYRSLYHHFECAAYLFRTPCIQDIEADFQSTLQACREVTEETIREETLYYKVVGSVLKLVAPLM